MIREVEKRRFRVNGAVKQTRFYYLRYRIGNMPVAKWVSLGVTDKQVAEKMASEFIAEKEREAAGIIEPKLARDSAKKPLTAHLKDYEPCLTLNKPWLIWASASGQVGMVEGDGCSRLESIGC